MPSCKTPEAEAARRRKLSESNKRYWDERKAQMPKPKSDPCACGCGELAKPGRRFIRGHSGGKAQKGAHRQKQTWASMQEAERDRLRAEVPLKTTCAHCGAETTGVVAETAAWFRQHAETCPGLNPSPPQAGPEGRLVHQMVSTP